ncbi:MULTISPECIES: hypothetical protein [Lachnospiraceae]|uniref:hypothetical protein n=1 Tax=Lachnospiraceae TaxID=186803 RepID=UPI000821D03F|nr:MULTISPECIES: hypothetical protein [Lachnospiraceae]MCB6740971.1 hypothetical protein [Blautia sp. 210820-DFI.6.14]MCQ5059551.1 hypothetical protein [Agathobacter rectalis]SCI05984.1 Uncharacterised protein [uncultured Ruminococcus sp.]
MVIMRIIIRVLLLPVRMCLTIIQLVVMFITWLSAIIFHVLSGIICITAILGYGFGQETGTETIRMLVIGFVLYTLPVLSGWTVVWLETIKIILKGD